MVMWIFWTIFMSETHDPYKAFEYNAKFVWVTRGIQGDKT